MKNPEEAIEVEDKNSLKSLLTERGSRYGSFSGHANLTQELKNVFYNHFNDFNKSQQLTNSEKEALDMILHKLGRIGNGDPHYTDSWVDIAGYATLVAEELETNPLFVIDEFKNQIESI